MPNPIDAATHLPTTLPCSALPINEANSDDDGNSEPTNAGAHNFAKEADNDDYYFDDYDEFVLCANTNSGAPPPAALHTFPTNISDKPTSPFKMINQRK